METFHPHVTYFAQVDYRNDDRVFGLLQEDRVRGGFYILGKTGTGKTNIMESLIYQDLNHHRGICVLDIHGQLTQNILKHLPKHRMKDLIYLDTSDPDLEWGYNPLQKVNYHFRHLITSHIIETFQKLWGSQSWGNRMQYILTQVLITLLDQPTASFEDISLILSDEAYRQKAISNIVSKNTRNFWINEFPKFSKGDFQPILTKIGSFLASPLLKKIMTENHKQISIDKVVNEGKILIVNLSKGMLGTDASYLLGSLIISSIASAGFQRMGKNEIHKPFFVYLDECQNYTTESLADAFSELRKTNISFIVAHQYLNQLTPTIRDAILGNVSNLVIFRCSLGDAGYFSKHFNKVFQPEDLVSLENYYCYLTILIDGKPSNAFSAKTLPSEVFVYQ